MSKEELNQIIATSKNEALVNMAKAELQKIELQESAADGDELSKVLLALKDVIDVAKLNPISAPTTNSLTQQQIDDLLKKSARNAKVSYDDLSEELKQKLAGSVKVELSLVTSNRTTLTTGITLSDLERPLIQKLLSDYVARNNSYLFGGAGTGKTYVANQIAEILGFNLITINCNQFTSPLDLLGGQTITGYQKGRLEMAWSNLDEKDHMMNGCVLLLDELPKLDPNTAGILNEALAKVKDFKDGIDPPTIRNGRGELLKLGNLFIIGTGNVRLNETSTEYEANFKQDLSLQDRFAGSTYEVFVDYQTEFSNTMSHFAFIWLYMIRLREVILENKLTGQAFVSIRIMMSMRDTYIVYRDYEQKKTIQNVAIKTPKTLKESLDSFLNLFKPQQIEMLKQQTNYNGFITTIAEKNALPLESLNTPYELQQVEEKIRQNKEYIASKTV